MKLKFKAFDEFIRSFTTAVSRSRRSDLKLKDLKVNKREISAVVKGSKYYNVYIKYNKNEVLEAECSCPYDYEGYCKHIIRTLEEADAQVCRLYGTETSLPATLFEEAQLEEMTEKLPLVKLEDGFLWPGKKVLDLKKEEIDEVCRESSVFPDVYSWQIEYFQSNELAGIMGRRDFRGSFGRVRVTQKREGLNLFCSCLRKKDRKICEHLSAALKKILDQPKIRLPFDPALSLDLFRKEARKYGIEKAGDEELREIFTVNYSRYGTTVEPRIPLLNLPKSEEKQLKEIFSSDFKLPTSKGKTKELVQFVVVHMGHYSDDVYFELYEAPLTKFGKMKSPVTEVFVEDEIRRAKTHEEMLFYLAFVDSDEEHEVPYQDILRNPAGLDFYLYDGNYHAYSFTITPRKLTPVKIEQADPKVRIKVKREKKYYALSCEIVLGGKSLNARVLRFYKQFFVHEEQIYYVPDKKKMAVIDFFLKNDNHLVVHPLQFDSFKKGYLDLWENRVALDYDFVKKAPQKLKQEKNLGTVSKFLIYLSEESDWIKITPVVRYADKEVALLTQRQIYFETKDGKYYAIERDEEAEAQFLNNVQRKHADFEDQREADFFYLPKTEFLDEGWFLQAFEDWRNEGYEIMGFNNLKNNNFNSHKASVQVRVSSGIDWFDLEAEVSFGEQKVSLKDLQKAIHNDKHFVKLSDGTQGILPEEWLAKLGRYFRSGEIEGNLVRTHRSNFQMIDDLFEEEVLSQEAHQQVEDYKEKLASFTKIGRTKPPKKLKAELRDYQTEGLNWLLFLDEFGFGGILADDMGLGKTIQLIAYFLKQKEMGRKEPHLVVVPTSLLFNWQRELEKFAPSLSFQVLHGTTREVGKVDFSKKDVFITSYGTMLLDIAVLKKQTFNTVVLDESQAIKNPASKRYKAARLLNGRRKIAATGTPIENNTFDLFAQLSFVMPGMLGSQARFKEDYATPIDKFQDEKRAAELQRKVHPFILRRTKKQVAKELPDKTEMVVMCEMEPQQKKVYEASLPSESFRTVRKKVCNPFVYRGRVI